MRWPLTGRSGEMRHIEAAIAAPRLSGVVVSGAAGVGKSRIAREALAMATARGWETRWVVGTASTKAVPLGAFAEWIQPGATETVQLVRGVIDAITSAPSEHHRVLLCVDDVQHLDDLSTFVVHQIVQRGAAKVVLTVRDGDQISPGVREIWLDAEFERLDLRPLSHDETSTLLAATLGGPVDPDAAGQLWRLTRGNVLYLHDIVEQGLTDGRITQEDWHWRWKGEPVVPADLIDLIESRMGALPASVNEVIELLAVAEPIELESLRRITDPTAVEEADALGLITVESVDGQVEIRVAHPLYGEVRSRRAPASRLRRLRALVANELAACGRRDEMRVVVRRATLSLDSDLEPDPDLLLTAAQGAVWLADLVLADRLSDAAIRAGGGIEAYLVRAHALSWLGRGQEADAALNGIPDEELSDASRSRVAFLRATNLLCAMADPAGAKKIVDEASDEAPSHARDCIDAFFVVHGAAMGEPNALEASSTDLALQRLPAVVGAVTSWALTVALGDAGHTTRALAAAETGYAIAASGFDAAQMRFVIADACVGALLLAGRIPEALEASEQLCAHSANLPGAAQLLGSALAGRAAVGAGRLDTACSLLEPAVESIFAAGDTNGFGYQYHLPRTVALAMRGSTVAAAAAFEALTAHRYPSWRYLDHSYAIAEAWVTACRGATGEAVGMTLIAGEDACGRGQFAAEVMCLQTAVQFGDTSAGPRLRELEAVVDGPRCRAAARFAEALHDDDGDALAVVSEEFERMGDLVAALDASAYAAVAYRRRDLRGSSLACSTRAEALAEQCGGARTPALRQVTKPLPLTDREREIVMLLGKGLSSRAVAERLVLSVRTVESHIYKAMAKTGTKTRDELAALISQ